MRADRLAHRMPVERRDVGIPTKFEASARPTDFSNNGRFQTMNKLHRNMALALCALAGLMTQEAFAQSTATINLSGNVTAGTCSVANVDQDMPPVSANAFPATGTGAAAGSQTSFDLRFTDCSGVAEATLIFGTTADAAPGQANTFANKANSPAPHTSIWLRDDSCAGGAFTRQPGSTKTIAITGNTANVPLCAVYHKLNTGNPTQGAISTNFTVSVSYN
jgi:type 1 fimbria pilin